ncbi:ParA family protein [Myxococcota bacterium]|nr:ParA family protein [Myxococcota bacterium]
MTAVCVINRKGGVGKTTLTLALADFLGGLYRKRVLLVDLDPQANLSIGCIGEERWDALDRKGLTVAGLFEAIVAGRTPVVHLESVQRISRSAACSLLVSTPRLSEVEAESMEADQGWRQRVGSPYLVLHTALHRHFEAYDYVLMDCPPSLGVVTYNGLMLANGYLVPVLPSPVSIAGVTQLVDRIQEVSRSWRRPLTRYGTIINRYSDHKNSHRAILAELNSKPQVQPIWNTRVPDTVRAEEGYQPGLQTLVQRWGTLHPSLGALTEEFVRRVR